MRYKDKVKRQRNKRCFFCCQKKLVYKISHTVFKLFEIPVQKQYEH